MKLLLVILCCFAITYADTNFIFDDDIDWSTIRTRNGVRGSDGELKIDSRIIGGQPASAHQFPYQGAIFILTPSTTYFCGCGVISPNYVITSGHCLDEAVQIQVRLGAHYVNANEVTQQRFVTTTFVRHPGYNPETRNYDVGVIRLPTPAILNDYVNIIPLPTWSDTELSFAGETARFVGWGITSNTNTVISETPYYLEAIVMSNLACNVGLQGQILSSHICTTGVNGVGACDGDSGGVVVSQNKLVGVISAALSANCADGWPTVHARITTVLDWISVVTDVNIYP